MPRPSWICQPSGILRKDQLPMARAGGWLGRGDSAGPGAEGLGVGGTGRWAGRSWIDGEGGGASGGLYVRSGVGEGAERGATGWRAGAGAGLGNSLRAVPDG